MLCPRCRREEPDYGALSEARDKALRRWWQDEEFRQVRRWWQDEEFRQVRRWWQDEEFRPDGCA